MISTAILAFDFVAEAKYFVKSYISSVVSVGSRVQNLRPSEQYSVADLHDTASKALWTHIQPRGNLSMEYGNTLDARVVCIQVRPCIRKDCDASNSMF